jgi:hypothetical protein
MFRPNLEYILRKNAPKTIFDYPIVHRLLRLESGAFDFGSSTPEDAVADVIQAFKFGRQAYDRTTDPAADPNYESTRDHYALWLRRFYSMRTRFERRRRDASETAADDVPDDVPDDHLVHDVENAAKQ